MSKDQKDTIYALRHKKTGLIKIGSTSNWERRISALGCKGHHDDICDSLGMIDSRRPDRKVHRIEKAIHHRLRNWRIPGTEWFFCDEETFWKTWQWSEAMMDTINQAQSQKMK